MVTSRVHQREGDVIEVPLPGTGTKAFGRLLREPLVEFYAGARIKTPLCQSPAFGNRGLHFEFGS